MTLIYRVILGGGAHALKAVVVQTACGPRPEKHLLGNVVGAPDRAYRCMGHHHIIDALS